MRIKACPAKKTLITFKHMHSTYFNVTCEPSSLINMLLLYVHLNSLRSLRELKWPISESKSCVYFCFLRKTMQLKARDSKLRNQHIPLHCFPLFARKGYTGSIFTFCVPDSSTVARAVSIVTRFRILSNARSRSVLKCLCWNCMTAMFYFDSFTYQRRYAFLLSWTHYICCSISKFTIIKVVTAFIRNPSCYFVSDRVVLFCYRTTNLFVC